MGFILWLLAVLLVVVGVIRLIQRDFIWGVALLFLGLLIGLGGSNLFM